jgi:hypothetical protein
MCQPISSVSHLRADLPLLALVALTTLDEDTDYDTHCYIIFSVPPVGFQARLIFLLFMEIRVLLLLLFLTGS